MEEEEIKKQTREIVEEMWKTELEKLFSNQINKCLMDTLKSLQKELKTFDKAINSHIQELDKNFNDKWDNKFKDLQNNISKLSGINNSNDNNNNNNNQNNLNNNNNNN